MPLTPTQLKDLETYRTSGELGSLKTILIDDCEECLDRLFKSDDDFDQSFFRDRNGYAGNNTWNEGSAMIDFIDLNELNKIDIVMCLLSRSINDECDCCGWDDNRFQHEPNCSNLNPYTEANMSFLDIPAKNQLPDSIVLLDENETKHTMWKANGTIRVWYIDDAREAPELMALKFKTLKENENYTKEELLKKHNIIEKSFAEILTLDKLIYQQFTEALRLGKDFETALGIITKTYLNEVYAKEND